MSVGAAVVQESCSAGFSPFSLDGMRMKLSSPLLLIMPSPVCLFTLHNFVQNNCVLKISFSPTRRTAVHSFNTQVQFRSSISYVLEKFCESSSSCMFHRDVFLYSLYQCSCHTSLIMDKMKVKVLITLLTPRVACVKGQ